MAKITDKAQLIVDTELTLDTANSTFTLNVAGNLIAKDGVTIQALYSKFIDLWTTAAYNKFEFPMYTIDAKSGQYIFGFDGGTYSGWVPADDATRQMLRDGGWSEYDDVGVLDKQYVGIVSLGEVSADAQLYYQKESAGSAADFTFLDECNEGILVYEATGDDTRTYFKAYVREEAKKYTDSILADTGQTATGAYTVNMLLSNEDDLDITDTDANVGTILPYTKINVKYFDTAYSKDVDSSTNKNFGIVVDAGTNSGIDGAITAAGVVLTTAAGVMTIDEFAGGELKLWTGTDENITFDILSNTATTITIENDTFTATEGAISFCAYPATALGASLQEIYTKVQYQLRQTTDIDASGTGVVTGQIASLLLNFVGATLNAGFYTPTNPNSGGTGVIIEGISDAEINNIVFYDNSSATAEYPYASVGNMTFNSVLTSGATGYYTMYFTDLTGDIDYGLTGAIVVKDKDGVDIAGSISSGTISFTFDYTGNVQGSRTGGTDAAVTLVAGNAGSAKPVVATGTITESKAIVIAMIAEQDRAYA